ncbi:MAG: hypothetical protein D6733_06095 [Methanobacteriota archaeon]|nr:MAG: hypothetical protein D6733_06095 [Euryarchaeota archaeon]
MIIDEVRLRNFRSHRDTRLSLGQGTTVIIGDNGAGKTSILEAVSFALFKEKPDGVGVDELISLGKTEGEVSVTFHSNGRGYRVRRRRDVKRGAESYLYLLEGDGERLLAKGEREVTGEVESILGMNGELFTSAVYIKQGEIDSLLAADASTRKRHIGRLIGAEDVERAYRGLLEVIRPFERKADELSRVPEELEEKKAAMEREREAVKEIRSRLSAMEGEVKEVERKAVEAGQRIRAIEGIRERMERLKRASLELEHLRDRLERIRAYEQELKASEEGAKEAGRLEKEIAGLREKVHGYDLLKKQAAQTEKEIEDERKRLASLRKELEHVFAAAAEVHGKPITTLDELEKAATSAAEEVERLLTEAREEVEKAQREAAEKKAALESLRKAISELEEASGTCPVCGRELTERHRKELMSSYSSEAASLEKALEAAAERLEGWKRRTRELEGRRGSIGKINVEAARDRERWLAEGEKKISELSERLKKDRSALAGLPPLLEKMQALEKRLSSLEKVRDTYKEALGFLRKNLPEKEGLLSRAASLEEKVKTLRVEADKEAAKLGLTAGSVDAEIEDARREEKRIQSALTDLRERMAALRSSAEEKERRISELKEEMARKKALLRERKDLLRFKGLLEKIRDIFHKDRLQKRLRLEAKPLIEEYTREVFLHFNLPYSDVTLTEDFSLKVHGPDGEESIDMLSGGERIAAALALRVGLSKALSGPVMELIILDEPTIHLDSQRRRELVDIIKRLATIPQTIVVTHDKEFEESADRIIEVKKVNGLSVVS